MSSNSQSARVAVLCLGLFGLGGCAVGEPSLHPSFGVALSENLAAQIAYPDGSYANRVAPPSDGARTNRAITRYRDGLVAQPTASASEFGGAAASAPGAGTP